MMTSEECWQLVQLVKALCPTMDISDHTYEAWEMALSDVRFDDAREALRTVYRDIGRDSEYGGRKVEADDILRGVRRIREERIRKAGDLVPPAGLDQAAEMAWLKAARRQIGDGGAVPDNGRVLGHRTMAELLAPPMDQV